MKYIVDTNVPKKASEMHSIDRLEAQCSLSCLKFIKQLMDSRDDVLVLDVNMEIWKEYSHILKSNAEPNVATQFLGWVQRNLTLREGCRVERIKLTVLGDREYEEFPESEELVGFDPSDRKFIALSNAHKEHPPVVEGSDSLWWGFKDALEKVGIHINFLCEEYVRLKYEAK